MSKLAQFRAALLGLVNRPVLMDPNHPVARHYFALASRLATGQSVSDEQLLARPPASAMEDEGGPKLVGYGDEPLLVPGAGKGKSVVWIPVKGMALYDLEWQPWCFSTLLLADRLRQFAQMEEVGTIVLDMDSPGGLITGTPEAGAAVAGAVEVGKRVVTLVNPLCASAAYWIASQSKEIVSTPSGDVGSVGVYLLHVEYSKLLADAGIKPTFIYDGKYKVEGNPYEPLADDAREYYQAEVTDIGNQFRATVAKGRETKVGDVAENYGQGRVLTPQDAKRVGMIDRIEPVSASLARLGVRSMEGPDKDGRRLEAAPTEEAQVEQPVPEAIAPEAEEIGEEQPTPPPVGADLSAEAAAASRRKRRLVLLRHI